jgi:adhesin/invasin
VKAPVVTFICDTGSAQIAAGDLSVDKTTVIANNTDAATFTAIVKDANGNPVPNLGVSWTTDRGGLSAAGNTDASGRATISLTSASVGIAQVTARVGTSAAVTAPVVNFVPVGIVAAIASTKDKITGSGAEYSTVAAFVRDAEGRPVAGATVNWTTDLGHLSSATSVTNSLGATRISLTAVLVATSNRTAHVTATINGSSKTSEIEVRAVILAGGKYYWTMQSDHFTTDENTATKNCRSHGGGHAAGVHELWTFANAGADFARMSVAGEYQDYWWRLTYGGEGAGGSFHSGRVRVGEYHRRDDHASYVCTTL